MLMKLVEQYKKNNATTKEQVEIILAV